MSDATFYRLGYAAIFVLAVAIVVVLVRNELAAEKCPRCGHTLAR